MTADLSWCLGLGDRKREDEGRQDKGGLVGLKRNQSLNSTGATAVNGL